LTTDHEQKSSNKTYLENNNVMDVKREKKVPQAKETTMNHIYLVSISGFTFLMNDINEDGGTPGFDEAACFTLTLSEPSDLLALCSASNIVFEVDEFCTSIGKI
jgi:hypothetical protein